MDLELVQRNAMTAKLQIEMNTDGQMEKHLIHKKISKKTWAWDALAQEIDVTVLYEKKMNIQNYFKVLEEAIQEIKELINISRDVLFLQIENTRYPWSIEALKFYYIKII